jgi:DNA-binding transcriptional LysR family regulator
MSFLVSLTHLRSFLGVAECASVTAAALALGYTQSAVSLHIKALERDLGTPLFHRDRSGMPLTAAGASFVAEAREMVENLMAIESRMRAAVAGCGPLDNSLNAPGRANGAIPRCRSPIVGKNDPDVFAQHSA